MPSLRPFRERLCRNRPASRHSTQVRIFKYLLSIAPANALCLTFVAETEEFTSTAGSSIPISVVILVILNTQMVGN